MVVSLNRSFCEKLRDVSKYSELYDGNLREDINKIASVFGFNKYVVEPIEVTMPDKTIFTTYIVKLSGFDDDSVLIILSRPNSDDDCRSIYFNGDFNGVGFEIECRYNKQWRRRSYSFNVNKDGLYIRGESKNRDMIKYTLLRKCPDNYLKEAGQSQVRNDDFNNLLELLRKFIENPIAKYEELMISSGSNKTRR